MAANRTNYLVVYKTESQVYGSASEQVALDSPPPEGSSLEDKRVFFVTYRPDTEELLVHRLADEDVIDEDRIKEKQ